MLTLLAGLLALYVLPTLTIPLRHAELLFGKPLNSLHPMSPLDSPSPIEAGLPKSPLDIALPEANTLPPPTLPMPTLDSFRPRGLLGSRRIADKLEELPPCQRQCVKTLHDTLGDVLHNGNYVDKYRKTCSAYKYARKCVKKQQELCNENGELFAVATSGIHYMCIEQGKAFNATIECVERNAVQVQGICEYQCHTRENLIKVITESRFMQPFGRALATLRSDSAHPAAFGEPHIPMDPELYHFGHPEGGLGLMDPMGSLDGASQHDIGDPMHDYATIAAHACQQFECALKCLRGKYDMLCAPNSGMLLSEAIIRPMALGHRMFPPAFLALGMMLPESCKFLSSGTRMLRHRIDPSIHAELLRKFGTTDEEEDYEDEDYVEEDPNNKSPIYGNVDLEALVNSIYDNETGEVYDGYNVNSIYDNETGEVYDGYNGTAAHKLKASGENSTLNYSDQIVNYKIAEYSNSSYEGPAEDFEDLFAIFESNDTFVDGSGEGNEESRIIVFRTPLSNKPTYSMFTANTTGILHCGVARRRNILTTNNETLT
ncbi:unnamed protein product [Cylicocyclus nassatus]|uniref:Chondroitin proteoglycan 4 domain-containing protein n=1 Tax=Cylicocyclus nassatus TaxID=53992 RepID=A0AA36GK47_CYLNA|nr:unnamed protein product [Cylicocyclus nassatus]